MDSTDTGVFLLYNNWGWQGGTFVCAHRVRAFTRLLNALCF